MKLLLCQGAKILGSGTLKQVVVGAVLLSAILLGCVRGGTELPGPPVVEENASEPPVDGPEAAADDRPTGEQTPPVVGSRITSADELRAALQAVNPDFGGQMGIEGDPASGMGIEIHDPSVTDIGPLADLPLLGIDLSDTRVSDISPLEGKPLRVLALERTEVDDISVVQGMPLETAYLSETDVEDISPLAGAPLRELNLLGTKVRDLSPLGKMPYLKMLWLNDTPVRDISPLATVPMVSLTLAGTEVSDLSPLKGHPTLERLHIARTPVTDLSVLRWLNLNRLIFTPGRIKTGMEYARNMRTLREIGTAFGEPEYGDDRMPPDAFWERFDAGEFR
jgi:hypothetical protein